MSIAYVKGLLNTNKSGPQFIYVCIPFQDLISEIELVNFTVEDSALDRNLSCFWLVCPLDQSSMQEPSHTEVLLMSSYYISLLHLSTSHCPSPSSSWS